MKSMNDRKLVLFSSILRWVLGVIFLGVGIAYVKDGSWPVMVFGVAFIVSGFFRPRRCLDDGCDLPKP
jgi:hypothetical protein